MRPNILVTLAHLSDLTPKPIYRVDVGSSLESKPSLEGHHSPASVSSCSVRCAFSRLRATVFHREIAAAMTAETKRFALFVKSCGSLQ